MLKLSSQKEERGPSKDNICENIPQLVSYKEKKEQQQKKNY